MERTTESDADRRIESLTVNLLECYEELDLIYRLSRGLKSTLDAQKSAELVLSEAIEIFETDMGWMTPQDPLAPAFVPLVRGVDAETVERLRVAAVRELASRGKSQIFYSVAEEMKLDGEGLPASLLCAVVKTESTIYGALCVGRREPGRHFTARDLKLADVLASQAAIAIENSILQRKQMEEEQALIRIEAELRLAREIQSALLPRSAPALPGYDLAGRGVPAQSVGGDYYDFIRIDADHLALCVADVSGHGMPAALLMANLQATIRSQAIAAVSPAECARRSNRLLYQSTHADRFVTCFYGILDLRNGELRYSNAGHDPPLILRGNRDMETLDTGGLILGVVDGQSYEQAAVTIERGDLLVVYSDGITESMDRADRPFGVERLHEVLEVVRDAPAGEILDAILSAATAHAAGQPQSDDMTLMVVRRR